METIFELSDILGIIIGVLLALLTAIAIIRIKQKMKKLIWAIMQIILGCCGLLMVIGRFVKMSQVAEDNLLLGLIITIWLVPGILTMRDYLRGRKE